MVCFVKKQRTVRQSAKGGLVEFDVRGFHDTVLKSGLFPLDMLEEQVDTW